MGLVDVFGLAGVDVKNKSEEVSHSVSERFEEFHAQYKG